MMHGGTSERDRFSKIIAERFRMHERCFAEQDAGPLAGFFAADAVWEFPGFAPLRGRDAVLGFFAQVVLTSAVAITPIECRVSGGMGWSLVDYGVTFADCTPSMTFRTIFIWSHSKREWLVELATGYKL